MGMQITGIKLPGASTRQLSSALWSDVNFPFGFKCYFHFRSIFSFNHLLSLGGKLSGYDLCFQIKLDLGLPLNRDT